MTDPGGIAYPPAALDAAAGTVRGVAEQVRGTDLAGAVGPVAAALPGSASAGASAQLAASWQRGIRAGADDAARHGDALAVASVQMTRTDQGAGTSISDALGP